VALDLNDRLNTFFHGRQFQLSARCLTACVQLPSLPCYLDLAVSDQMTADHNAPALQSRVGICVSDGQSNSSPTSSSSGLVDLRSTGSTDSSTVLEASGLLASIQRVIRDLQHSVVSTVSALQLQV
jgi:hypothetical protein